MKRIFTIATIAFVLSTLNMMMGQALQTPATSVPRLITFNGALTDRTGQPLSGVVGVTFSLYKDQQGGVPAWTENQNVQLDAAGRYSILLGATQGEGLPADLFTSGESRWLGVQAQLPGQDEQARVLLVSVPYALKAADADTIGGKPASAFVMAQPVPDVNLAKSGDKTLAPNVRSFALSGTANRAVKWDGTGTTLTDSSIQDNGTGVSMAISNSGFVGIGTTSPSTDLSIGTLPSIANVRGIYSGINGQKNFLEAYDGSKDLIAGVDPGVNFAKIGTLTATDLSIITGNDPTKGLYVQSNGKVGIGTTNPGGKLDVVTTSNGTQRLLNLVAANNIVGNNQELGFQVAGNADVAKIATQYLSTGQIDLAFASMNSNSLSEVMRLHSGNVGIGTVTPAAKLDVNGTVNAGLYTGNQISLGNLPSIANVGGIFTGINGQKNFFEAYDGSKDMIAGVDPGINFGKIGTLTATDLSIITGNDPTKGLYVQANGNVGVGTLTPAARLDVSGTLKAAALSGDGSALTNVNATTVASVSSSSLRTRGIVYLGGCDSCSVLQQTTDNQPTIYVNVLGTTMTIVSVVCYADTGTPTINILRHGAGSNLLLSDLQCNGTPNSTFSSGEGSMNPGESLDFLMQSNPGSSSHRVTVAIKAMVN